MTLSEKFSAISPIITLLIESLFPPHPKTKIISFSVNSRKENKAAVKASGV